MSEIKLDGDDIREFANRYFDHLATDAALKERAYARDEENRQRLLAIFEHLVPAFVQYVQVVVSHMMAPAPMPPAAPAARPNSAGPSEPSGKSGKENIQ
jgi:hypothetical protein